MTGIFHGLHQKINEFAQRKRSDELVKIYRKWTNKGDKVLDVGCGDGILSENLKIKLKIKLSGCDIHNYLLRDIPFTIMTQIDRIPFRDKTFDIVLLNDVLHHTLKDNQAQLIRESIRVAKKTVIINEMLPTAITYAGDVLMNKITHPTMEVPLTLRKTEGWMEILEKLPVKIQKYDHYTGGVQIFPHVLFILTHKIQKNTKLK